MSEPKMSIGQLARAAGVTSRAIRHYHREGLLAEPDRSSADHRHYDEADLQRLLKIVSLRRTGWPIADIAAALCAPTAEFAEELRERAAGVEQTAKDLRRTRESVISDALGDRGDRPSPATRPCDE